LRQQYDILGLDLDDDDEHHDDDARTDGGDQPTTSQGIVHDMASMVLTTILQMGIRTSTSLYRIFYCNILLQYSTEASIVIICMYLLWFLSPFFLRKFGTAMMAIASLLVVRYWWLLYPALAFLGFVAFRNRSMAALQGSIELVSPFLIGAGLIIMYSSSEESGSGIVYWLGESLVIAMFTYNSVGANQQLPFGIMLGGVVAFSMVAALWFRGKFWNYAVVIGFQVFLAIFVAMAFPVMEMVLEAILNEKLKKVGEKVRLQHKHMEKYYSSRS